MNRPADPSSRMIGLALIIGVCSIFWFAVGLGIGLTICNSKADEWKTTDMVLFGSYVVLSAYDAAQTDQCLRAGTCIEKNPMLGEHPSTARLYLSKALVAGGIYWLVDRFPDVRRPILLIANAMEISVVAHNASLGFKVRF